MMAPPPFFTGSYSQSANSLETPISLGPWWPYCTMIFCTGPISPDFTRNATAGGSGRHQTDGELLECLDRIDSRFVSPREIGGHWAGAEDPRAIWPPRTQRDRRT